MSWRRTPIPCRRCLRREVRPPQQEAQGRRRLKLERPPPPRRRSRRRRRRRPRPTGGDAERRRIDEDPASDDGAATTGGETSGRRERITGGGARAPRRRRRRRRRRPPPSTSTTSWSGSDAQEGVEQPRKNENRYYYLPTPPAARARASGRITARALPGRSRRCQGQGAGPRCTSGAPSPRHPRAWVPVQQHYRTLIKSGVEDSNYMTDEKGELRFNFKNKGFERKNKDTGVSEIITIKPEPNPRQAEAGECRSRPSRRRRRSRRSRSRRKEARIRTSGAPPSSRRRGEAGATPGRRRSTRRTARRRRRRSTRAPRVRRPAGEMRVEEPAISPYGHVAGYETWCRILRQEAQGHVPVHAPASQAPGARQAHTRAHRRCRKMVDTQQ